MEILAQVPSNVKSIELGPDGTLRAEFYSTNPGPAQPVPGPDLAKPEPTQPGLVPAYQALDPAKLQAEYAQGTGPISDADLALVVPAGLLNN